MNKYSIKQNLYSSPIDNLTFLDRLIFNFKLIFVIVITLPMILISICSSNFVKFLRDYLPIIFHKLLLWLFSVKIEIDGNIERAKKCNFFVSNHLSYLDIPILGSNFPIRFVAKSEVASWPIFGFLAKLARTIFIYRNKFDTLSQKDKIKNILLLKEKILIFPEGTTSDGNRVFDFKSSSFSAVEKENFMIQPITLIYAELNGIPINRWLKPLIAWYGDMEFQPHLSALVNLRSIKVKLIFSEPVNSQLFSNRKELSHYLEKTIKTNYTSTLSKKLAKYKYNWQ